MYVLITKSVDLHGCKQKKKKQLNVPGYLNKKADLAIFHLELFFLAVYQLE